MGDVYKAQDARLKRTVALKFLAPNLTRDEEAKRRFIHEAQAASAIDQNKICTVYEIDETDDGQMFIATSHYPGETLTNRHHVGGELAVRMISYTLKLVISRYHALRGNADQTLRV